VPDTALLTITLSMPVIVGRNCTRVPIFHYRAVREKPSSEVAGIPRWRRWRRCPILVLVAPAGNPGVFVLGVLVASFTCAGLESFTAAAQWHGRRPGAAAGAGRRPRTR
jgi:hypothetical protein